MSLISRDYIQMMARYNLWQSTSHRRLFSRMTPAELEMDRGAFFGSIMATANHLLWGDGLWMSRFDGGSAPDGGIAQSTALCRDLAEWDDLRAETDLRIITWANAMTEDEVESDLTWFSGAAGREITKPRALCITHFFNHQTHHRGQIHTMLTAAGQTPIDSDLFLMPEGT